MKAPKNPERSAYRGRIAPTPSGWLHLGHAATFTRAWQRARAHNGTLVYRTEDLDPDRCRPEYVAGAIEDLCWWGLDWDEGPDRGGPFAPYTQSQRMESFRTVFDRLRDGGFIFPSRHSRKEIAGHNPASSPVDGDAIFPVELRPAGDVFEDQSSDLTWRFRVPDGRMIHFTDNRSGDKAYLAGRDFGDFIVWRRDGLPSYDFAVVVDDHAMEISEVVRGEDLLVSTARQLLIYEALGWNPPEWYHCELVIDPATGKRMSKTHQSLGLRALREAGHAPGMGPAATVALTPRRGA
jgi:glutamyl-tRNA synthetase